MQGSVLQINISPGGIPKRPVPEALVTRNGIAGDSWNHPKIHGGPRQALLLIASESIAEIAALGYPVYAGALGENLTTRGLDRRQMRVGQRYRVGEVLIELTKLRAPCNTLSVYGPGLQGEIYDHRVKAGDHSTPRWGLAGFYASIVHTGIIRGGDMIVLLDQVV